MAALTLRGVNAYYGKAHILQDMNLSLGEGEVIGVFGRNGVGKTTMLRSIMNLVPRVTGSIELAGVEISDEPTAQRVQRGLGYMPQGMRVFGDLSVEDNYRLSAFAVKQPTPLEEIIGLLPELRDLLQRPAGRLSGGQQQMVSLMRTLASNCKVMLMDEPTEGLMPRMVERIAEIIRLLRSRKMSVLLVEQNLTLGEAVCDRAYIVEKGHVEAEGTFQFLKKSDHFGRFLGVA